jgi:hypothetical protein
VQGRTLMFAETLSHHTRLNRFPRSNASPRAPKAFVLLSVSNFSQPSTDFHRTDNATVPD